MNRAPGYDLDALRQQRCVARAANGQGHEIKKQNPEAVTGCSLGAFTSGFTRQE
jgi:hypothetical protein